MIPIPHNTRNQQQSDTIQNKRISQPSQQKPSSNQNKSTATKETMCVEIHHLLACGHYNEDFPNPFEIRECQYVGLTEEDKRFSDRVNGKHTVKQSDAHSFDYDYSAICEECREKENERLRRRQPLKWPNARDTI